MRLCVGVTLALVCGWATTGSAIIDQQFFLSQLNQIYWVIKSDPAGDAATQITSLMAADGTAVGLAEILNDPPDPVVTALATRFTGGLLAPLPSIRRTAIITGLPSNEIVNDGDPANGEFDPVANGFNGLLTLPGGALTVSADGLGTEPLVSLTSTTGSGSTFVPAAATTTVSRRFGTTTLSATETIVFPNPSGGVTTSNPSTCVGGASSGALCNPANGTADCPGGSCTSFGGEAAGQNVTLDDTEGTRVGNPASQGGASDGFLLQNTTDLIVIVIDVGIGSPGAPFGLSSAGFAVSDSTLATRDVLFTTADADNYNFNTATPTPTATATPQPTSTDTRTATPTPTKDTVSVVTGDGGTATTDAEADGTTASDVFETSVTTPNGGEVTISENLYPSEFLPGIFDIEAPFQVIITAPPATAENPLVIVFEIDTLIFPSDFLPEYYGGLDPMSFGMPLLYRNFEHVPPCDGVPGVADPDPCVASRLRQPDGDAEITVLTSAASEWTFAMPTGTCPSTVDEECVGGFQKGFFLVKEGVAGREKLIAKMLAGPALAQTDLGNPLGLDDGGLGTFVLLCVYDAGGNLAGELLNSRPTLSCGNAPCWKPVGPAPNAPQGPGKGYKYEDPSASADGITKLLYKAGSAGKSKVIVKGAGPNLPDGIAAALQASNSVTLQVRAAGAECLSTTLHEVKKSEPGFFKIK